MCVVCTRSQMAVDTLNGQMSLHILIRVFLVWPVSSVNLLCQNSAVEWLIWNFSNWLEIVFVRIRWRWFEKFQVGDCQWYGVAMFPVSVARTAI